MVIFSHSYHTDLQGWRVWNNLTTIGFTFSTPCHLWTHPQSLNYQIIFHLFRFPLLLPITEPEAAVNKIMNAILTNQRILLFPRVLYFLLILKRFVFISPVQDVLSPQLLTFISFFHLVFCLKLPTYHYRNSLEPVQWWMNSREEQIKKKIKFWRNIP